MHLTNDDSFNIFEKLREWSTHLENWERLALLRLLQKGAIDKEDIALIYKEFKTDKDLEDVTSSRVTYDLNDSTIPQLTKQSQNLLLAQIKEVKNVNAIIAGQVLCFGPSLTVIYGSNGSGKSGYARILKSACFTRSPFTNIYGNVNIPSINWDKASATFVFSNETSVSYCQGVPCPQLRDNFAIFDNSCIRVCIDSKNDFMVNPYGFDIFQSLVDVIAEVKKLLEEEIEKKKPDILKLQINNSFMRIKVNNTPSQVATLLNTLSGVTDLPFLKDIGNFGPKEEKRLIEVTILLDDLIKKDPTQLLKEKRTNGRDIKTIIRKLLKIERLISTPPYVDGNLIVQNIKKLRDIASATSAAQFGKEPVQPVGTETWRNLIEAAIKYSEEAFPDKTFPLNAENSRCLLCQQLLNKEAGERLKKFYAFIRSEAENKLRNELRKINELGKELESIDFNFFSPDILGYRTIEEYDIELVKNIIQYVNLAKTIYTEIINNLKFEKWDKLTVLPISPISQCIALRNSLAKEIKNLRKQNVSKQVKELEEELQLLKDRQHLNKNFSSVEQTVLNLRWIDKAQEPKRNLNSHHVTVKQKALVNELIGKGFMAQFKEECENLGLENLTIKINITGSEAITKRNFAVGKGENLPAPSEVLSEGEQTAVAMADFLAEISLNKAPIGIIFDDPVNSMDHLRKEKIAKRLVNEACKRQVIIFTHDILFTHHLADAAEKIGVEKVNFTACTVSLGTNSTPGYIGKEVFPHVHYEREQEKVSENYLSEAKNLTGEAQKEKLELGCGALRAAYEYFIQDKLFGDVVKRWREPIRATLLSQVYFSQELNDAVVEHFEKLSRYEKGHSKSVESQEVPLDINFLEKEISIFKEVKKQHSQLANNHMKEKEQNKKVFK